MRRSVQKGVWLPPVAGAVSISVDSSHDRFKVEAVERIESISPTGSTDEEEEEPIEREYFNARYTHGDGDESSDDESSSDGSEEEEWEEVEAGDEREEEEDWQEEEDWVDGEESSGDSVDWDVSTESSVESEASAKEEELSERLNAAVMSLEEQCLQIAAAMGLEKQLHEQCGLAAVAQMR